MIDPKFGADVINSIFFVTDSDENKLECFSPAVFFRPSASQYAFGFAPTLPANIRPALKNFNNTIIPTYFATSEEEISSFYLPSQL